MKLKKGVNPFGMRPEIVLGLFVADPIWLNHGHELVVTSINDSRHSNASLHYAGCAADLRTRYFSGVEAEEVADELRDALGNSPDYDVVVESDHIHFEYQPKSRK